MPPYQTSYGNLSAMAPKPGTPNGEPPRCMFAIATGAIAFGDPVEWVSESAKTAKAFDGAGTICGFAMARKGLVTGAGIVADDEFDIAYEGLVWVKAGSALTVGAAYPGCVNGSVVREVAVDGAQNLALVQLNMPARGPAL